MAESEALLENMPVDGRRVSTGVGPAYRSLSRKWAALVSIFCALLVPNRMLTSRGPADDNSGFAYIGWLMHRGYVPYRDVWDHKGPLLYYLNWLGWTLTPHSTVGIGILQAVALAFAFYLIIDILRRFTSVAAIIYIAALSIAFLAETGNGLNMTETWALTPIALAHWCVLKAAERARWWQPCLCGVAFSLTFWIRPNLCVVPFIAAIVITYFAQPRRVVLINLLWAAATATAAILLPIVRWGVWGEMVDACFRYNRDYSHTVTLSGRLLTILSLIVNAYLVPLLPLAVIAWIILRARKSRYELATGLNFKEAYLFFLWVLLPIDVLAALISGRGYLHYLGSLWPTVAIFTAVGIVWLTKRPVSQRRALRPIVLGLILISCLVGFREWVEQALLAKRTRFDYIAMAEYIARITKPEDRVQPFNGVESMQVALLARRLPASRYIYEWPLMEAKNSKLLSQREEFLSDLRTHPPAVIFTFGNFFNDDCETPPFTADMERKVASEGNDLEALRQLMAFKDATYRLEKGKAVQGWCVYRRIPSAY
jgi:hypothetical protein